MNDYERELFSDFYEQKRMLKRDRNVLIVALIFVTCAMVYACWSWDQERKAAEFWMNKALTIDARSK